MKEYRVFSGETPIRSVEADAIVYFEGTIFLERYKKSDGKILERERVAAFSSNYAVFEVE